MKNIYNVFRQVFHNEIYRRVDHDEIRAIAKEISYSKGKWIITAFVHDAQYPKGDGVLTFDLEEFLKWYMPVRDEETSDNFVHLGIVRTPRRCIFCGAWEYDRDSLEKQPACKGDDGFGHLWNYYTRKEIRELLEGFDIYFLEKDGKDA